MSSTVQFFRLPANVIPVHYALEIRPNLATFTFEGKLAVNLEVKNATSKITLHSLDLTINKVTISEKDGDILKVEDFQLNVDDETLTLNLPESLAVTSDDELGPCLSIEFNGCINDDMKGFYRSKYVTPCGKERYAAVTQFCPTDARRCFPCWDEPAFKATFDVTLIVEKDRLTLSNMPVKDEHVINDELKKVQFETTPIMSTYLLAFVVGEYDFVEDTSDDGVLVRVYTPLGRKSQGKYALEVATKALVFYKNYFNIAYPLPKMDLIAIADFSAGAMENWGLITYRETRLLADPENTSLIQKQAIALTVSHEVAHQWFGNLVTMEWWTDIWLNEGYATFMEFHCVDHAFPNIDIWTQFATDEYTCALGLDSLQNSHPIEIPINSPAELNEIFDVISYKKGASIIRMLCSYIGEELFRKGMTLYLNRHQYKNARTEDLWSALGEVSEKPISNVMSTWTKQMGYPVVSVDMEQDGTKRFLSLTQTKFSLGSMKENDAYFWLVPIVVASKGHTDIVERRYLMDKKEMEIFVDNVPENAWIKLNSKSISYFRTKYTGEMLKAFVPFIKDQTLPQEDRLGLIDDMCAIVMSGKESTVQMLEFLRAYKNETNFTVWTVISECLAKLQTLLAQTDVAEHLNRFGIELFTPISEKLGWTPKPDESQTDMFLRTLVLNRLVNFNASNVLEDAAKRFEQHLNGTAILLADLRTVCYKAALKRGGEKTYNQLIDLYTTSELNEEQERIGVALASSIKIEILQKAIDFALSENVRNQDSVLIISSVSSNPIGRDLMWEFFKINFKMFRERYTSLFLKTRLAKYITAFFTTEEQATDVETFFKENPFPGTERTVSQSIEKIRLNDVWLKRDLDAVRNYFQKQE